MASEPVSHVGKVEKNGDGKWQATCPCGFVGPERRLRGAAAGDSREHGQDAYVTTSADAGPMDPGWCGNTFHGSKREGRCPKCNGAWKRKPYEPRTHHIGPSSDPADSKPHGQ